MLHMFNMEETALSTQFDHRFARNTLVLFTSLTKKKSIHLRFILFNDWQRQKAAGKRDDLKCQCGNKAIEMSKRIWSE